jgi:hypothetical protein
MSAADHSEAGQERGVDRSHNRDTLSSEAMTEMLRDLQDAMLALDERLGALESSHAGASDDTRKLARGVADMGDALARRVRAIEQGGRDPPAILIRRESAPPPPPLGVRRPRQALGWAAALVLVFAIALGALWLMTRESLERGPPLAQPKPIAMAPPPSPAPSVALTPPPVPTPALHTASHGLPQHRSAPWRASAHALPQSSPPPAPTGFAHYGPSPPPPASAPAAAQAPSRPPS